MSSEVPTHDLSPRKPSWLEVLLAVALLPVSGCTVGPKYHTPVAPVPSTYKELKDWKPAQPNDQNLGGAWWTIFQDPQLDALELQVNVSNQNLKAAEAQYRQARAVLAYNRADYYPTVTVDPSATRTRVSPQTILRIQSCVAPATTTLCCPSICPTKPMSGDEFEKRWSLPGNKRKPVRQTWLRSI